MRELTPRQAEILQHIRDWTETTGSPPTRAEIARHFGFRSPNAAEAHLKVLARKGVLDILPGTSRGSISSAYSVSANISAFSMVGTDR